jgi:hypothetical protein
MRTQQVIDRIRESVSNDRLTEVDGAATFVNV